MKKWIYVIIPGAALALFVLFYNQERAERMKLEQQRLERVAEQKAADDARRVALEHRAREESDARAAAQAAEAAQKEADRIAKYNADLQRIKDAAGKAEADMAASNAEAKHLTAEKNALEKAKEQDINEEFDLTQQVEQARVNQQDAALDNERMVAMIADRASQSHMAQPPPPPPAQ